MAKKTIGYLSEVVEDVMVEADRPKVYDKEWTSWVLSQMDESEVHDGHPTVRGLRRFCDQYFGELICSTSEVCQSPNRENGGRACVRHNLIVLSYDKGREVTVSGVADCCEDNTSSFAKNYPSATAETRAEGRAYVRLLRLDVCSSEEIGVRNRMAPGTPDASPASEGAEMATNSQIVVIDMVSKRLDINPIAYINKTSKKGIKSVRELTNAKAQEVFGRLAELRKHYDANTLKEEQRSLLNSVGKYDSSWKE